MHFHCLGSVCGLFVVVGVVVAATAAAAAAVAVIVDIDVYDVPRVRKSEMKKRRESTGKNDDKLIVTHARKDASAFLKTPPHA